MRLRYDVERSRKGGNFRASGENRRMRKRIIALFFAGCFCGFSQSITVQNASFDTATLPLNEGYGPFCNVIANSDFAQTNGTLASWVGSSTTADAAAGALSPTPGGENWTTKWFAGGNVAYLQIGAAGTVSLAQKLTAQLQNNTMYTLSALVGNRVVTQRFNYAIQLWAGSTQVASTSKLTLANNSYALDTLSYSSGVSNTHAGEALTIVLSATGVNGLVTEAFFDQVTLSAKATFAVNGVLSATAFGGFAATAPGDFVEIYGVNLATDSRNWNASDFVGGNAPTSLDGTSVTIGGQKAFVSYISPSQVNALVPSNVATRQQTVTVTNASGATNAFAITINAVEPGLLATSNFLVNGTQYAVALNSDGTYALPTGAIAGLVSHPATPGDTLVLYGLGFGPVTPSIPAGQLVAQTNTLATAFQMFIGGMPATAVYSGLAPDFTGLYQFNIVVPNVDSGNAVPVTFALSGTNGTQKLYIAVQD
jgi:uncharacterized protein (TIGR03437 family)